MIRATLESKELSFVLRGQFNPVIFHPQWLARKTLISESQADVANLKVNHAEISEFDLEFCTIQVLQNQFSATSKQETHFDTMRDLVVNIFDCLLESHITQIGINFHHHYRFEKKEDYNNFGHKIVPKDLLWEKLLQNPGLFKIQIEGERSDNYSGKKVLDVGISKLIKRFGIGIQLNDHYDLYQDHEQEKADASRVLTVLREDYNQSLKSSEEIILGVYNHGISG